MSIMKCGHKKKESSLLL